MYKIFTINLAPCKPKLFVFLVLLLLFLPSCSNNSSSPTLSSSSNTNIVSATMVSTTPNQAQPFFLARTADGGQSWQPEFISSPFLTATGSIQDDVGFRAISCPSVTTCYTVSVAGNLYQTTNSGQTWQLLINLAISVGNIDSLNCPTEIVCFASSTTDAKLDKLVRLDISSNNVLLAPLTLPNLTYLTSPNDEMAAYCPTTNICLATALEASYGDRYISPDGGKTWQETSVKLGQIVCPTASVCYILNSDGVFKTTDSGKTWTSESASVSSGSIKCPTVNECLIVQKKLKTELTIDGGNSWQQKSANTIDVGDISSLTCPSIKNCLADTTDGFYKTIDSGNSWTKFTVTFTNPYNLSYFKTEMVTKRGSAISCPSEQVCYSEVYYQMSKSLNP